MSDWRKMLKTSKTTKHSLLSHMLFLPQKSNLQYYFEGFFGFTWNCWKSLKKGKLNRRKNSRSSAFGCDVFECVQKCYQKTWPKFFLRWSWVLIKFFGLFFSVLIYSNEKKIRHGCRYCILHVKQKNYQTWSYSRWIGKSPRKSVHTEGMIFLS